MPTKRCHQPPFGCSSIRTVSAITRFVKYTYCKHHVAPTTVGSSLYISSPKQNLRWPRHINIHQHRQSTAQLAPTHLSVKSIHGVHPPILHHPLLPSNPQIHPMTSPQNPPQNPSQDAQHPANTTWLESLRRRLQSPSQRNPDMSWHDNAADQISHQLQTDNHRTWGFVIYRTTYAHNNDDADWPEFLSRLRFQMEDMFDVFHGRDILEKFALTVFEDASLFDGASTDTIRQHFQRWAVMAYRTEQQQQQQVGEEGSGSGGSAGRVGIGRSPRYRFAIQVDAVALHSVVHDAPAAPELDTTKKGWVKLIDKSWYLGRSEGRSDPFEPIEGVTEEDVGWMKVPYQDVMTEWYTKCRSFNNWSLNYRRPPKVAGSPFD